MSVTHVLLDILVVLLVGKLAAELAERLKIPAVVGEIVAGILIGPSALGLVDGNDVLRVLAEIGVILLLLDVGFEMDLGELAAVGRASLTVAAFGVIVPFAAGWAVAGAFGMTSKQAMFVGAALTATSVGITARVFGDLRALTMVEARTVLGAAVADDVIGLVILTVVVRLASEGSVAPLSVLWIVVAAIGFLVLTTLGGVRIAPALFDRVAKSSRSSGTLVAVALAFTLAFAELASAAKLAPIVGAFVAGLALARSPVADRIRRELTPVGHLFIPVFFLQIGIEADVSQFGHPAVLRLAGALLLVAIVGKLCSAVGLFGSPGDRLLVGIGMIPRGEVGLIFATLGLRNHIFGEDIYGALLLVVLATTLLTPPPLRWRLLAVRSAAAVATPAKARPEGGWLQVTAGSGRGIELVAEPPLGLALTIALEAGLLAGQHRPGPRLLDWLSRLPEGPLQWDRAAREKLFELLRTGGPRSWRFLALTGILDKALPALGHALAQRQDVAFELDPTGTLQWPTLSRLREVGDIDDVDHPEWLLLGAIVLDATDDGPEAVAVARQIVKRLDLGAAAEQAVAGLVADARLLTGAARRLNGLDEESVLQLAVHLRSPQQARRLYYLTLARDDLTTLDRHRLSQLHDLVQAALAHPELTGRQAANAVEQRRAAASGMVSDPATRARIQAAPRAYLLASTPADIARHAAMCEPPPRPDEVRVKVQPDARRSTWRVDIAALGRVGLLAAETYVLSDAGADVLEATIATWGDRCALASFVVSSPAFPDAADLKRELRASLRRARPAAPLPDACIDFDQQSSPWHTLCRIQAPDHPGLLHAVTAAFAVARASVHSAKVATVDGTARDVFELTDRDGHKLGAAAEQAVRRNLAMGVTPRGRRVVPWQDWRRWRRTVKSNGMGIETQPKQTDDRPEMTAP